MFTYVNLQVILAYNNCQQNKAVIVKYNYSTCINKYNNRL